MKLLLKIVFILISLFFISCGVLRLTQEKLIFYPEKLEKNYPFRFINKFEELNITSYDGISLNGLLFKSDSTKGLIFYLHGNAGSLNSWGKIAKTYTDFGYDVFMLDYRGFGKSEDNIKSKEQLFQDNQIVYTELKKKYNEKNIIILGYSIGTGLAAKLASENTPKLLILQAPYYSLTDLMKHTFPIIPTFILKYKINTNEYLKHCKMPVIIFHGTNDEVIYYGSSLKLEKEFKFGDKLITLQGQEHNGITENEHYKSEIRELLK